MNRHILNLTLAASLLTNTAIAAPQSNNNAKIFTLIVAGALTTAAIASIINNADIKVVQPKPQHFQPPHRSKPHYKKSWNNRYHWKQGRDQYEPPRFEHRRYYDRRWN